MSDLCARYLNGDPALAPYFAHGVNDFASAAAALPPWNADLRAAILDYQHDLGLTRDIAPDSLAVVTGQQPGLLTGPLYTIYKAITAIKLARRVAAETGRATTPIFWCAADDHDFEEVRETHLLTQDHADLTLRYEPTGDVANRAMHRVPIEDSLHALIDKAADAAAGAEFSAEIRAFLHDSLAASCSFSDWFCRILARLFRDTTLVLFTTELPAARRAAAPIFNHAIRTPLATTAAVNTAGNQLTKLGFDAQVVKAEDECAFFLEVEGRRRKVLHREGTFLLPEEGQRFFESDLLARLAAHPEDFSANVALRPIVQQALFPTVAYIGGPGEVAYWAQFKGVFEHFGQPMPVVYPRAQAVLSTIKLNKLLAKYGFNPNDLLAPKDALLQRALAASVKSPALDTFRRERENVVSATTSLRAAMLGTPKLPKPAAEATAAAEEQIIATLDRLEKALLRGDAAQTDTARKQVDRLCAAFAPDRKPQERVYTLFSFLFEHGWGLIDRLTESIDTDGFAMNEVEL